MKKIKIICITISLLALSGTLLFNYFLKQMENPTGLAGNFLFSVWNATFKDMTHWGLNAVDVSSAENILDVGIGGGETLNYLATTTTQNNLYGIDISADSIAFATNKNKECINEGRIKLTTADIAALPFENESFDLITAFQTHIYWQELDKGLEEIHRVLQTDGTLLIVCEKDKIDYHLKQYKNPDDFVQLLLQQNFEKVEFYEYNNWIYFKAIKN